MIDLNKKHLNLGCPNYCKNYICVDTQPRDNRVIKNDAYSYLLSLNENSIEEINSKNLLEELPNIFQFLLLCKSVLKPKGKITIITDNALFLPHYIPYLNLMGFSAHSKTSKYIQHSCIFTSWHLQNMFRKLDLTVEKIEYGIFPRRIPYFNFWKLKKLCLMPRIKIVGVKS